MAELLNPGALQGLLDEYGLSYKQNSISYILACPLCLKAQKLYLRKRDGAFRCWVCYETKGFGGRAEFALHELTGLSLGFLRSRLYGSADLPAQLTLEVHLRDFWVPGEPEPETVTINETAWAPDTYALDSPQADRGRVYLEGRGVPLETALRYGIRYQPSSRRVCFPISAGGRLYGWQGRLVVASETAPKALTEPAGLRKDRLLMFADRLLGQRHAVLCEGPVDALKADLCGGNVAALGKGVSPVQLGLLRNAGLERLYLGLDPDASPEARRLLDRFPDVDAYVLRPPAGREDLGDCSPEEVLEAFRAAPRLTRGTLLTYVSDFETIRKRLHRQNGR